MGAKSSIEVCNDQSEKGDVPTTQMHSMIPSQTNNHLTTNANAAEPETTNGIVVSYQERPYQHKNMTSQNFTKPSPKPSHGQQHIFQKAHVPREPVQLPKFKPKKSLLSLLKSDELEALSMSVDLYDCPVCDKSSDATALGTICHLESQHNEVKIWKHSVKLKVSKTGKEMWWMLFTYNNLFWCYMKPSQTGVSWMVTDLGPRNCTKLYRFSLELKQKDSSMAACTFGKPVKHISDEIPITDYITVSLHDLKPCLNEDNFAFFLRIFKSRN